MWTGYGADFLTVGFDDAGAPSHSVVDYRQA
jgi:hypothetical protein